MRTPFAILFTVSLIFGIGFWYTILKNPCGIPITYRIGEIDERFSISSEEVRMAAYRAERLWEEALFRDLFTYSEESQTTINFIYDDRQKSASEAHEFEEVLTETADLNESIRSQYEELLAEYEVLKEQYNNRATAYEQHLATYYEEVSRWNERGGAPPKEYRELERRKDDLDREQQALNEVVSDLNKLVRSMNMLSSQGNEVIDEYNEVAKEYNDRFGEGLEFTQGDYKNRTINVYQFNDIEQLTLVIAHEFGHAITLGHVVGEESIMFESMDKQSLKTGVSEHDIAEFTATCSTRDIPYVPFI